MRAESLQLVDHVLIVFRKDDVAQLVEGHQRLADADGIAVLLCDPDLSDRNGGDCQYRAIETPKPLPRAYDIRSPELTRDMAETIETCFANFQSGGELRIESNLRGLWFITPWAQRFFIGLARHHDAMPAGQSPLQDSNTVESETQPCVPLHLR